ncbi:MAG: TonB-dependent receptor domain-containing protein [Steroidobacteraceae bacterium]
MPAALINNPDGGIPLDGQQAYTPRWSGNVGLSYRIATPIGSFVPRVDGSFHSLTYFDAANDLKQPSYEVYGASVKFIDATEPFSLAAGVVNLTDRVYIDSAESGYFSPIGYQELTYAPPRAWFLQGSVTF